MLNTDSFTDEQLKTAKTFFAKLQEAIAPAGDPGAGRASEHRSDEMTRKPDSARAAGAVVERLEVEARPLDCKRSWQHRARRLVARSALIAPNQSSSLFARYECLSIGSQW